MRRLTIFWVWLGFVEASVSAWAGSSVGDLYGSFSELSKAEPKESYRIRAFDRGHPILVLAIHGGKIEPQTSEIAQAVAKDDFSLYLFEGTRDGSNWVLHITSSHFDEPTAVALAKKSKLCVSIHGYTNHDVSRACVGGGNKNLRKQLASAFSKMKFPFQVEEPCVAYEGVHPNNIVNLCHDKGVQLELSQDLRENLAKDEKLKLSFAETIRQAVKVK